LIKVALTKGLQTRGLNNVTFVFFFLKPKCQVTLFYTIPFFFLVRYGMSFGQ
jgi:hypothetical protein